MAIHASTAYFCKKCGASKFADKVVEGTGTVTTYTIITVPPASFERYVPYAFVVMKLDGVDQRISGFMSGVSTPADLSVGAAVRVYGYDERGVLIQCQ